MRRLLRSGRWPVWTALTGAVLCAGAFALVYVDPFGFQVLGRNVLRVGYTLLWVSLWVLGTRAFWKWRQNREPNT